MIENNVSNNNQTLISVIIPVYNVQKYLDRCIESIINQTYTNLEIILIDDGSTDMCPQMCDEWAKKDSRIKVIHKANGGVSSARNAGLEISSGTIVHFVDSDDWIEKNAYNNLIEHFDSSSLLVFNAYSYDGKLTQMFDFNVSEIKGASNILTNLIKGKLGFTNCWSKLFSLDIIKKYNLLFKTNYKIGEDYYFLYEYSKHIESVKFINEPLYYYDISRTDSAMNMLSGAEYDESHCDYWQISEEIMNNEICDKQVFDAAAERLIRDLKILSLKSALLKEKKTYLNIAKRLKKYYLKGICREKYTFMDKCISFIPNIFRAVYRGYKLWK
ncbi:MAG: glycosyltransferase [Acetobacter sp.]|nr:glycosyltransferase [Bacteroides sp.]MCM1341557.1 glycosyltransferase [Acetobacter sp.]MCM1433634.1 glycosyltransferase [Clostridiales bacterium]